MLENGQDDDIMAILYSLKDIIRACILDQLFANARNGISFKAIVKNVGIGPTTAAYHLNVLKKVGFAEKRFRNEEGRRDYSFYYITPKGERAYITAKSIHRELWSQVLADEAVELPDIQITHLRYGPRCISFEKLQE